MAEKAFAAEYNDNLPPHHSATVLAHWLQHLRGAVPPHQGAERHLAVKPRRLAEVVEPRECWNVFDTESELLVVAGTRFINRVPASAAATIELAIRTRNYHYG